MNIKDQFEIEFAKRLHSLYNDDSALHEAILYATLSGGKRVRAQLCLHACEALGSTYQSALNAAMAVEMVHAYSLIHDDLPLLDNDDFRRGLPSTHKKFDEQTALLAGDALLADAFFILTGESFATNSSQSAVQLVQLLAGACGGNGMVLGQMLDLQWTQKTGYNFDDLKRIHLNKTGKLIAASLAMGAVCASGSQEQIQNFYDMGLRIGLAFQILDDLLDSVQGTGKSAGKDEKQGKLSCLKVMTRQDARRFAEDLTESAKRCIPAGGLALKDYLDRLIVRES